MKKIFLNILFVALGTFISLLVIGFYYADEEIAVNEVNNEISQNEVDKIDIDDNYKPNVKRPKSIQSLEGKLISRPATKSTESYCATFSDNNTYFLQIEGQENLLLDFSLFKGSLAHLVNKKVTITGRVYLESKVQEDNNMQAPITPQSPDEQLSRNMESASVFTCNMFKVHTIE